MGWKPKIKLAVSLIKCRTCGVSYNNPLTHVCKIDMSKSGQRKVTKAVKARTAAKKPPASKKK